MKNLGNLSPNPGARKNKNRKGRGIGSGNGKTAGKGHKGQKARKGGGIRSGFEGGQTPLYKRTPKHGFTNTRNKVEFHLVNLSHLEHFNDGELVTSEQLFKKGLVANLRKPIKLLANGKLTKKNLEVKLQKVSKQAKQLVEANSGKVEETK